MKRREILKYTALMTGAVVSLPLALSLSSCTGEQRMLDSYTPQFFMEEDFAVIQKVIDIIIPKTESPSATEVGVHQMIDNMVMNVYSEEAKKEYKEQSRLLIDHLSKEESLDEQKLLTIEKSGGDIAVGYRSLKQQTVAYYLNTEEVGTKFLNYLPVPGEYDGCIELSEVGGKAWAI